MRTQRSHPRDERPRWAAPHPSHACVATLTLLGLACSGDAPSRAGGPAEPGSEAREATAAPPPSASAGADAPRAATADEAYDLAADLAARRARALAELGEEAPMKVTEDVFLLVGAAGWKGAGLDRAVELTESALAAYFNGRFESRPSRAITVFLFPTNESYQAFCRGRGDAECLSPYGFYDPNRRDIIMNAGRGLGTLTHELVHPIVETDFPSAPTWIDEGIASLFEAPAIPRAGEIHGLKNWRLPRLLEGLASEKERAEVTLPALFAMGDGAFRAGEERLHYAMARYFCQWMDERGELWPFYRRWRADVATDPTGEKAFFTVTGKTPAELDGAWRRWVQALGASKP